MDEKQKCDKYEAFFTFQDEEAFNNHLENCPNCKEEHEKYLKVSALVKEVAPEYLAKRAKTKSDLLKRAACIFVILTGLIGYTGYKVYEDNSFQINSVEDSYIYEIGLPTDSYGFLEL